MSPGQMIPGQMSAWQLSLVKHRLENLSVELGQYGIRDSQIVVGMDFGSRGMKTIVVQTQHKFQ